MPEELNIDVNFPLKYLENVWQVSNYLLGRLVVGMVMCCHWLEINLLVTVNLNLKKRKEKFNHELSTDVIHTVDFITKTVTCFQFKISGALSLLLFVFYPMNVTLLKHFHILFVVDFSSSNGSEHWRYSYILRSFENNCHRQKGKAMNSFLFSLC